MAASDCIATRPIYDVALHEANKVLSQYVNYLSNVYATIVF